MHSDSNTTLTGLGCSFVVADKIELYSNGGLNLNFDPTACPGSVLDAISTKKVALIQ